MNEFPGQFDRRTFIASAGATAFALALPVLPAEIVSTQDSIIVNSTGADDAPGSLARPIHSLDRALTLSRSRGRSTILLRAGTYELTQPLHITPANAPLRMRSRLCSTLPSFATTMAPAIRPLYSVNADGRVSRGLEISITAACRIGPRTPITPAQRCLRRALRST